MTTQAHRFDSPDERRCAIATCIGEMEALEQSGDALPDESFLIRGTSRDAPGVTAPAITTPGDDRTGIGSRIAPIEMP